MCDGCAWIVAPLETVGGGGGSAPVNAIETGDDARLNSLRVGDVDAPSTSTGEVAATNLTVYDDGSTRALTASIEASGPVLEAIDGYHLIRANSDDGTALTGIAVLLQTGATPASRFSIANIGSFRTWPTELASVGAGGSLPGNIYYDSTFGSLRIDSATTWQPQGQQGTWNVTVFGDTDDITANMTIEDNIYVRYGNMVYVQLFMEFDTTPTGGGYDSRQLNVRKLPWEPEGTAGNLSKACWPCITNGVQVAGATGSTPPLVTSIGDTWSTLGIEFKVMQNAAAPATLTLASCSNGDTIRFSGWYLATDGQSPSSIFS